jgi:signal transduction histidine kinase
MADSRSAAILMALGAAALEFDAEGRCVAAEGPPLPGHEDGSLGKSCAELLGPSVGAALARAAANERVTLEWRTAGPDGGRAFEVALGPGGESVALAVVREVTEQRRRDARLVLSGRMASISTLAGGAAHGINNPLATIVANLEFTGRELARLRREGEASAADLVWLDELDEAVADARTAADRIRSMVRDLQRFSSSGESGGACVDVNRAMDATLAVAWPDIRHRARLVKDLGAVPLVAVDEAHVRQLFLNLVINAAQAIPEGNAEGNLIAVRTGTDSSGRAVVEVRDTGSGISAEILPHIFDPFFTTKPLGAGTGVGLAVCRHIVAAAGGEISVESEVGRGSRFHLTLPAAPPPPRPAAPPPAPGASRRARILVIDDDALVGSAIRRALAPHHDVVAVTKGGDALARLASGERFDLLICDLLMPDLTGAEVYDRVLQTAPGLARRMIFLSGGAFTPRTRDFLARVPNPRLEKPFEAKNLLAVVERALG